MVDNMFDVQDSYNKLVEKVASLKEINRPSDDAVGMTRVLNLRESLASIEQYSDNIESCQSWLTITESKLSAAGDLLVNAREVAVGQSTATASAETRSTEAETIQQLIDEMLTLANAKYEGRYLFTGTKSADTAPFASTGNSVAEIGTASSAGGNAFDGTVTSGGTYTGSTNKTYVVKITDWVEGTRTATYNVSADGGETWTTTGATFVLPEGGSVGTGDIGDGIELTFEDSGAAEPAANDIFYVDALVAGYYNGNGGELTVNIGEDTPFAYSISGEAAFTDEGNGEVDIFGVLAALKQALENNDQNGIADLIDDLEAASDQISANISKCGTRANRLELASTNMTDMELDLTELISVAEDADVSEVITQLSMKQIALQASYSVASRIGSLTILDWLR
jgi:flagellar hook-associated protein 3 FlgL